MGRFDHVPSVLRRLGVREVLHKIAQRPGKPMWFGVGPAGQTVFGLPGNPVSALVCLVRYVGPALQAMMRGRPPVSEARAARRELHGQAGADVIPARPDRTQPDAGARRHATTHARLRRLYFAARHGRIRRTAARAPRLRCGPLCTAVSVVNMHDALINRLKDAANAPVADAASSRQSRTARSRDQLGRPIHDLRISVMDRCNFRCPYCMPRDTFHDRYRFLRTSERLTFEEIARLARLARDARREQIAPDGRRAVAAQRLARPRRRTFADRRHRGSRADDQRRAARATCRRTQRQRSASRHRQPRLARRGDLRADEWRVWRAGPGARRHRRAHWPPGCIRSRSIRSCSAVATITRCSTCSNVFAAPVSSVRLIEYMDVGNRNDWRRKRGRAVRRIAAPDQGTLACLTGRRAVSRRSRRALSVRRRRRRDRLRVLGQRAVLW